MVSLSWNFFRNLIVSHLLEIRHSVRLWDFAFYQMVYAWFSWVEAKPQIYINLIGSLSVNKSKILVFLHILSKVLRNFYQLGLGLKYKVPPPSPLVKLVKFTFYLVVWILQIKKE